VKEGARLYSTHSLRATTATLLLDAGVDIRKVQELLGHRHVITTQIYDKRRRTRKAHLTTCLSDTGNTRSQVIHEPKRGTGGGRS
jgi:site-specific recombinase XerD